MAEGKKIATGYVGNALRSSAADHTTTFTDEVFDTKRQKYQSEVNTDIESKIEEETKARELAITTESQARTQNDQLLSQAIAAEQERAEAAEEANARGIDAVVVKNEGQDQKLSELEKDVIDILKKTNLLRLAENGEFFIADEDFNVVFKVVGGYVDALGLGENLTQEIIKLISNNVDFSEVNTNIESLESKVDGYNVKEEGTFYVDENGNIGISIVNGKFEFANLSADDNNDNLPVINRVNKATRELNILKNKIDDVVPSLLSIKESNGVEKTITIPSVGTKKKYMLTVRMHYGSKRFTPDANEVFFDKGCKTDFSDVRFFLNGKMLKNVALGNAANIDIIAKTTSIIVTSDGIIFNNGSNAGSQYVTISRDGGNSTSVLEFTRDITTNESIVYGRKGLYVVGVDNNDNVYGYAGGKMYRMLNSENYTSIHEVCDFHWVDDDGTVIYPDIQDLGFGVNKNNTIVFGVYQEQHHLAVYVSTNGGASFHNTMLIDDQTIQHVHNVNTNRNTKTIYVSCDDSGATRGGAYVFKSEDEGQTWTDISENFNGHRCHDYYPNYIGEDFRLGGGESYTYGGESICRLDANDENPKAVLKGLPGVRRVASFGNDNFLVAGTSASKYCCENQLLVSEDKGMTWKTIFRGSWGTFASSGSGFRVLKYVGTLAGENEPCIVVQDGHAPKLQGRRIYKGGDNYYREAYIMLDEVPEGDIVITAKSGYQMPYPYKSVNGYDVKDALVWELPLNEGAGNIVQDTGGNCYRLNGASWDDEQSVRYGEHGGDIAQPYDYSCGLRTSKASIIGKIPSLSFNKDFTLTFWLNTKNINGVYGEGQRNNFIRDDIERKSLFSIGSFDVCFIGNAFALSDRNDKSRYSRCVITTIKYIDDYIFFGIIVKDGTFSVSCNGYTPANMYDSWRGFNTSNISDKDIVIGSDNNDMIGYISDLKIYNRQLTQEELLSIYKGFTY